MCSLAVLDIYNVYEHPIKSHTNPLGLCLLPPGAELWESSHDQKWIRRESLRRSIWRVPWEFFRSGFHIQNFLKHVHVAQTSGHSGHFLSLQSWLVQGGTSSWIFFRILIGTSKEKVDHDQKIWVAHGSFIPTRITSCAKNDWKTNFETKKLRRNSIRTNQKQRNSVKHTPSNSMFAALFRFVHLRFDELVVHLGLQQGMNLPASARLRFLFLSKGEIHTGSLLGFSVLPLQYDWL